MMTDAVKKDLRVAFIDGRISTLRPSYKTKKTLIDEGWMVEEGWYLVLTEEGQRVAGTL